MSKLKLIHDDKKRKDHKHAYHPIFDFIEHKLVGEIECILIMKQTRRINKYYLVKWQGCHLKEFQWVKLAHLDHLPKVVGKFEHEHGHEVGNIKTHKNKSNASTS